MKKSLLLVLLVLVMLAATAAPGVAAPKEEMKTTYYGCERFGPPTPSDSYKEWQAGPVVQVRGLQATATEFVWTGSAWEEAGTNSTLFNITAKGDLAAGFPGWSDIFLWGTFHIDLNLNEFDIGEYTGSWRLLIDGDPVDPVPDQGPDAARGREVDGKRLSKDDLDPDPADFPAGSLALLPANCSPIMFTIIDPGN